MNIAQLVEATALDAVNSKACKAVDALIRPVVRLMREGERLTCIGLGFFSIQQKKDCNPCTDAPEKIPSRKVNRFRPTAVLA